METRSIFLSTGNDQNSNYAGDKWRKHKAYVGELRAKDRRQIPQTISKDTQVYIMFVILPCFMPIQNA